MKVKVISLPYIFQVLYVLCFTWTRYQVSVSIGPLVNKFCSTMCFRLHKGEDGFVNMTKALRKLTFTDRRNVHEHVPAEVYIGHLLHRLQCKRYNVEWFSGHFFRILKLYFFALLLLFVT